MVQEFTDRQDAGRQMAQRLVAYAGTDAVVLALPRGGVPVGYEIAVALGLPLDVLLVRKLGAPGFSELGIGAVVDGETPKMVLNEDVMKMISPSADYVEAEKLRQLEVIGARRTLYRQGGRAIAVTGRTAIVIDDGAATGGTASAALAGLAQSGARRLVLALPVAPPAVVSRLSAQADEVICLHTPADFSAVGFHYACFDQVPDADVIDCLARAAERPDGGQPPRRAGT